jgi:hypothetical protein
MPQPTDPISTLMNITTTSVPRNTAEAATNEPTSLWMHTNHSWKQVGRPTNLMTDTRGAGGRTRHAETGELPVGTSRDGPTPALHCRRLECVTVMLHLIDRRFIDPELGTEDWQMSLLRR